jgi:hypothetical protein
VSIDDFQDQSGQDEPEDREHTFTRKALLQAGWAVPVAIAIAPSVAHAASGVHADNVHADAHADSTP